MTTVSDEDPKKRPVRRRPQKPRVWSVALPTAIDPHFWRDEREASDDNRLLLKATVNHAKSKYNGAAGVIVITSLGYCNSYATQVFGEPEMRIEGLGHNIQSAIDVHGPHELRHTLNVGLRGLLQLDAFDTAYGKRTRLLVAWTALYWALRGLFNKRVR